jgi:hypothetical protein
MLGLPDDSTRLEVDILLNNAKQRRLEAQLHEVLAKREID